MAVLLLGCCCAFAHGALAEQSQDSTRGGERDLDEIAFPGLPQGLLRIQFGAGFVPQSDAGDSAIALAVPNGRISLQGPLGERVSARVFANIATQLYDVSDESQLFPLCGGCPAPDQFYSATLGLQGAFQLNDAWHLIRAGERWALLGELGEKARWEENAFERSLETGAVVALGYELPKRLRVAIGAQFGIAHDGGEFSVGPTGAFRWDPTPWLRLRNRGFGLELQARALPRLEVFVAGYRNSDQFRLRSRPGLPSDTTFEDRRWQAGLGFEWKLWRWLRLAAEAGAMFEREVKVDSSDEGELESQRVDPSPYIDVRVEFRP